MYRDGRGGLDKDNAQAVQWYSKSAVQGDADAQYRLGNIYRAVSVD